MVLYEFNESIFSKIDSLEKAYWIGFLYADGYVSGKTNAFGMALKQDDIEQLEKLADFLGADHGCISYAADTKSYRLTLTRAQTHSDLLALGFTSNKSYDNNTDVWDNIPMEYKKSFILGFSDGDGSFSITPKGVQIAGFVSNNGALLSAIVEYINLFLGDSFAKLKEPTPGDPYFRIRFAANKAKIFGDWLYQDAPPYKLGRKYEQYSKMEIHSQAQFGFANNKTKGILCLDSNKAYVTAKEAALNELGVDNPGAINGIRSVCRGERKQTRGKHFRYLTEEEKERFEEYGTL